MTFKEFKKNLYKCDAVYVGTILVKDCCVEYVRITKAEILTQIMNLSEESKNELNAEYYTDSNKLYFN